MGTEFNIVWSGFINENYHRKQVLGGGLRHPRIKGGLQKGHTGSQTDFLSLSYKITRSDIQSFLFVGDVRSTGLYDTQEAPERGPFQVPKPADPKLDKTNAKLQCSIHT